MSRIDTAVELFRGGCACSQAVLAAYGEGLGLDGQSALRLAAGFAGGMRRAETCGAVTGAIMVLGLRHAGEGCERAAGRAEIYARVVEFTDRFRGQNGGLLCRDLLGCDISTPEGMQQARERDLFRTRCVDLVGSAAGLLEEMEQGSRAAAAPAG
ncbi:MAG: C-GCAxxG-C-C family protein [Candidatus Latescibacterota bacterium]